ncbi:MAG: tyrosine-type recombinase/integrase [Rhodoferax sp.]|nr:tyrosine-type recombinase/integrase [Rhodoferax sp.]
MAGSIDTVKGREALKPRHAPYWHKISTGCFLGFRKITSDSTGAWLARYRLEDTGAQKLHSLGKFEELPPTERFGAASKAASKWFEHMGQGGSAGALTVREACENYVEHLRGAKPSTNAADDADGRFKRWVYPNAKLAGTPLQKLTQGQVTAWRNALAKTRAMHQDKSKEPTRERSSSSLNRDMATLRAALNLALEDGHCTSDHAWAKKLKTIKGATGRRDIYLDLDQRRALIAKCAPDIGALLRALSLIPLRPGAIASLVVGNFDKRLSMLTVGKDKSGKDRRITLPPVTAKLFAEQCKNKLPTAPIFTRADGKAWNKDSWKGPFKEAAAAAGLPPTATAYVLRHSVITDLISLHRVDLLTVAQLSGTSLEMIDKHYGHLLQKHGAEGLARLAL